MRGRSNGGQKNRLITSVVVAAIFLGFLYVYYGSIFGSSSNGASALEYGSKSLRKFGSSYLGGDDEADGKQYESSTKVGLEDGGEVAPKTFPVCDDRHSELIPCLDRNIIYQMRLKLDLSVMEHYERHCPPPERRYNCLIPPPPGYKSESVLIHVKLEVPIKWPQSRDEVWKANIPHTLTLHMKSLTRIGWLYKADPGVARAPGVALGLGVTLVEGLLGIPRTPWRSTPGRGLPRIPRAPWRIDWLQRDGILLLELDRLLRPGGYFSYSSSEAYAQDEEDLRIWRDENLVQIPPPVVLMMIQMQFGVYEWKLVSLLILIETWRRRVESYWNLLSPKIEDDTLRNLMDMKVHMGSFAVALKDKNVWVMNVIPKDGPNTLKLIYDRGLIGTTHDWCEAFFTYPRTYDSTLGQSFRTLRRKAAVLRIYYSRWFASSAPLAS
ncbi:putative methyltransferase PMT1 [Hibiscus syriacus]|uniref:Methyltransferase n=1 Tax=Hibiscus syriacus TaxID=106335 RepID=A0A6A2XPD9_HIBSY|nr:putative methyltransferase PMT1 [Hibiscus syriacus]